MKKDLKVAIVCDWLTDVGGAELVLLEIHKLFPKAPIYTSQYNPKKINWFKNADVRTGWLQYFPAFLKKLLPVIRAIYFSHLKLNGYDLVITSNTGAEAKAIKVRNGTTHVCYMHAPTHYYWSRYEDYLREPGWGSFDWLGRFGLKTLIGPMRKWDYKAAQKPDYIIANSTHTQQAIKHYYDRESIVIHPPIDTDFFQSRLPSTNSQLPKRRSGFVITGRHTPYKRIDLAVEACTELGLPLKVLGDGPEHQRLREIAGPTIEFNNHASREDVRDALQSAEAFIFPGIDDFGIAPVEALAAGTPVIAFEGGGALDYIIPGKTGQYFFPQTIEALKHTLEAFDPEEYNPSILTKQAQGFSKEAFTSKILKRMKDIT